VSAVIESIGNAELWLGDCREILPSLGPIDAVVTDPPYGMDFDTNSRRFSGKQLERPRGVGRSDRKIVDDGKPFDPSHLLIYPQLIVWGANHYAQRLPVGTTLVWLKRSPQHYGTFLSDAEIGWQAGGKGVYVFYAEDSNGRRRLEFTGSIMGHATAHPSQKPISIMAWCIRRVKANLIVDPYMGSGTTAIACAKLGRRFIGIEIDPQCFEIACKRLEKYHRQGDLISEVAAE
jgi:site-specific DNA-methyltransferase (adenine-specific)